MELSINLKKLLLQRKLTEAELARQTGIAQPIIHRILSGQNENPKLATIKPIAKFFNLNLSQLLGETLLESDHKNSLSKQITPKKISSIPLLSEEKIQEWIKTDEYNLKKTILTDAPPMARMFAIELNDNSMEPQFSKGTVLIFDTGIAAKNKHYVIARFNGKNIFRQIVAEDANCYLMSISPLAKNNIILLNHDIEIFGVLVQAKKDFSING